MRCNLSYAEYLKKVIHSIETYESNNRLLYPSGKLEWTLGVLQGSSFHICIDSDYVQFRFIGHWHMEICAEVFPVKGEDVVEISTRYLVEGGEVSVNHLLENESEKELQNLYLQILKSLVETKLLEKVKIIR